MRAFEFAARQNWAILTELDADGSVRAPHLKRILDIALRANEPNFEAVAQKLADRTDESGVLEMHGDVAVVNVVGPIFRYANLFTWISGATSVQEIAKAFRTAVDDPAVRAVVLNIDSPGGEVAGISELATAIYEARGAKPCVAYADDLTASAAYWLASAAGRVVASDTAELGSIGVIATLVDRGPRDGVKTYQFISSVSPKKRPDLETEEGRATVQQRIDDLASVFVSAVARNRGVTEDKVLSEFGRGGVMIASKAVAAGMADEIGTFEGVMESLAAEPGMMPRKPGMMPRKVGGSVAKPGEQAEAGSSSQGGSMNEKTAEQWTAEVAAARTEGKTEGLAEGRSAGIKTERERVGAILGCVEAKGRENLARTVALETDTEPEAARKLLAAAPLAVAEPRNPLAAAMAGVNNPAVGVDRAEAADESAEAKNIVAAYKAAQGVK